MIKKKHLASKLEVVIDYKENTKEPLEPNPKDKVRKEISTILGSIPVNPGVFIGRDDDLEIIHEKMFSNQRCLLLVNGEGGIGKTSVASKYYHKYFEEYSHLIWVIAETGIMNALMALAIELQIEFDKGFSDDDKIDRIIKVLMGLKNPSLLVIDNANELRDLEYSWQYLQKCSTLHLLLTSRITTFANLETYQIKSLNKDYARELFVTHYAEHDRDEDRLLDNILEAVGYNTLVIELLAKNLSNFNNPLSKRYSLQNLLEDIQKNGVLGLCKSDDVSTDYRKFTKAKPEEIVEAMYDISGLIEEEKVLLSVFAVMPAINIHFEHLKTLLFNVDDLDKLCLSIAQKGWIEYDKGLKGFPNFKCNPIVQEIARKQNCENLSEHCKELISSLDNQLDHDPYTGHFVNGLYEDVASYIQYGEMVCKHLNENQVDLSSLFKRLGSFLYSS